MIMRIVARGAWMGWGIALCLGTLEAAAADAPVSAAAKPATTAASNAAAPVVTPEAKAQREKVMEVETVAKDVSVKRDSAYLNEARKWDKKRREEEAEAKSRREVPADSSAEGKATLNSEKTR